jgi:hypothetical protein
VQKLWQCGEGEDDHMVMSFLHGNIGVFVCDCWLQIYSVWGHSFNGG